MSVAFVEIVLGKKKCCVGRDHRAVFFFFLSNNVRN